jgi:hypothetical protein
MKVYIQTDKDGEFFNISAFNAFKGFKEFGWEILKYEFADEIEETDPEIVCVGGIGSIIKRLKRLGIDKEYLDFNYPLELEKYLGRKVWLSTLQDVLNENSTWNVFCKPQNYQKRFTGKVFREFADFIGIVDTLEPIPVWCSEVVEFTTEWRCFIRYGEILDIRYYKGAWDSKIDVNVVKDAVADFKSSPKAYAMDFGADKNGNMRLVEVNEGHSIGDYGIGPLSYAKFLSAHWAEMTKTKDYLYF